MHIGRKALEEDGPLSLMYHRLCKYCTNMPVVTPRMIVITLCIGSMSVMLGIIYIPTTYTCLLTPKK